MQVLAVIGFVACGLLLATFVVGFLRVLRHGVTVADQIDRAGFGPRAFWWGELRRQSASSSVATREGLRASASGGKISVQQTRTISRELF